MKKAILHIGSEKTGSTSIQQYLHLHRDQLSEKNCTYPQFAGLISNFRLVLFAHSVPDADLLALAGVRNELKSIEKFKQKFFNKHTKEVREFQAEYPQESTVVYSSEHLQSRITRHGDIAGLKLFLKTMYDSIEIVVYLRRQDRFAMSSHNTAIQGGNKSRFDFDSINVKGPYYDYAGLLNRWARVFGPEALCVKFFEADRLYQGSVVADFCEHIGISAEEFRQPGKQNNERLSYTAQETLLAFNRMDDTHPMLLGYNKEELRQDLIKMLHSWDDDYGVIKPSKKQALKFYAHFKEQNDMIADTWLSGQGFNEDFSDYPDAADPYPVLDSDFLLDKALSQCLGTMSKHEATLMMCNSKAS